MIEKFNITIFDKLPSLTELFTVAVILGGSLISGIIFKRIVLKKIIKITSRTKWQGDDIIVRASRNVVSTLFFVAGIYFSIYVLPFSPKVFNFLLVIVKVSTIFIITLIVARIIKGWIDIYQINTQGAFPRTSILQYLVKTLVYIIGFLIILQTLGISITPILTALGVGGLAVALALQDTLSNLFAGLQIVAAKNIHPDDYVKLDNGDEGYIQDINWRSTTIRALSNRIIVIPNQKLASSIVNNFSKPDKEIAVLMDVGVSYNSDLEQVEKVTIDVAREIMKEVNGGVKVFEPFIRYNKFDAYSINFTVIMRGNEYVDQYLIKHEFVKKLHARYKQEGIEIPFPITTVLMPDK